MRAIKMFERKRGREKRRIIEINYRWRQHIFFIKFSSPRSQLNLQVDGEKVPLKCRWMNGGDSGHFSTFIPLNDTARTFRKQKKKGGMIFCFFFSLRRAPEKSLKFIFIVYRRRKNGKLCCERRGKAFEVKLKKGNLSFSTSDLFSFLCFRHRLKFTKMGFTSFGGHEILLLYILAWVPVATRPCTKGNEKQSS